jgi:hypothetical protein
MTFSITQFRLKLVSLTTFSKTTNKNTTLSIMTGLLRCVPLILSVIYTECSYAECRYAGATTLVPWWHKPYTQVWWWHNISPIMTLPIYNGTRSIANMSIVIISIAIITIVIITIVIINIVIISIVIVSIIDPMITKPIFDGATTFCRFQVDLRHIDEENGRSEVEIGVDLVPML